MNENYRENNYIQCRERIIFRKFFIVCITYQHMYF